MTSRARAMQSWFTVAVVAAAVTAVWTQSGELTGLVIDRSGAVLPGVEVEATLESNPSVTRTATTDGSGQFSIQSLPTGSYRVRVASRGFAQQIRTGVPVVIGQDAALIFVVDVERDPEFTASPGRPSARPPASSPGAPIYPFAVGAGAATVPVFFATDRERRAGPLLTYGTGRNPSGALFLGRFDVTVPRDHRMGDVERPSIWTLWREDAERHFIITHRVQLPYDDFYAGISQLVQRSSDREAFVFIHGFNVAFEDAIYWTAQLTYDLGFDGAPILYSWPSAASLSVIGYTTDSTNSEWTEQHLRWFLEDVAARSGAERVHLIAHSMGNKALVNALDRMALSSTRSFSQIVLTAPDIDTDTFKQLAAAVAGRAERTTLYASSNDQALRASKTFASYPRAGDVSNRVVVVPGIDTVDVSELDTDFLGHSYYGSNDSMLSDLYLVINEGLPPWRRPRLVVAGTAPNQFWRFAPS